MVQVLLIYEPSQPGVHKKDFSVAIAKSLELVYTYEYVCTHVIYIIRNTYITLFNLKNEGNTTIWDTINKPGEHYTKWNKPGSDRQIVCDLTYM